MDRDDGAAVRLPQTDREELAIRALARSEPVSDLAVRHGGGPLIRLRAEAQGIG
jgi:hypothetical protein